MNNKEKYINDIEKRFEGKTKELLLKQVNLFYDNTYPIQKNQYNVGEEVQLKKRNIYTRYFR